MIDTPPLEETHAWIMVGFTAHAPGATTAAAKTPTATNHDENRSCRITRLLSPEDAGFDEAALVSKDGRLTAFRSDCKQYFANLDVRPSS
jgi:hypothetical protein